MERKQQQEALKHCTKLAKKSFLYTLREETLLPTYLSYNMYLEYVHIVAPDRVAYNNHNVRICDIYGTDVGLMFEISFYYVKIF